MSWNLTLDNALENWENAVPDLNSVNISSQSKSPKHIESNLDPEALFAEPRSLDSSEFSDSSSEKTAPAWTTEEDSTLIEELEKNNYEWETVIKSFPNKSAQSIKRRWNNINKNKAKHEWTEEEDKLILSLYKTHGGNWKKIATYFNGISSVNIKNRFYGCIKRRLNFQAKK